MRLEGAAKAVAIYIGSSDRWHSEALEEAILQRACKEGLAGATVLHGRAGFGANSVIHRPAMFRLSQDLPVVIQLVDSAEKIDAFMPILDEMVKEGLVITWKVELQ